MSIPQRIARMDQRIELGLALKPLDEVLGEIFERYGLPRPGGRSRKGWSSRQTLQKCPYLYQQTYVNGHQGAPSQALETGSLFHSYLACHYLTQMDETYPVIPDLLRDELLSSQATAASVAEAWQLYEAYACRYENDYLRPLAVEEEGEFEGNTCRWDLIAAIDEPQPGLPVGTYVVESKTSSRFDSVTMSAWANDGEILGQLWIYQQGDYAAKWGPIRGVIMNLCKKRTFEFERLVIPPQGWQLDGHAKDLDAWDMLEKLYRTTGLWPRSRANCVTRYGQCALFSHCMDGTPLDSSEGDL